MVKMIMSPMKSTGRRSLKDSMEEETIKNTHRDSLHRNLSVTSLDLLTL